ncbi:MAG: hypothetical protein QF917_05565 [Candidatus Woesearchaeota archaeon]|mgnify:FL=1|jgi:hypothetical protein|nr:hypothetical protein [Candidatus Woesearchaeota archaeon]|tara:strand:- start:889 stop:1611 length:723 start_codon:yes stop_codon:yes gene_type:complete
MALETIIPIIIILLIGIFLWGIFKRIFKVFFYVGIAISLLLAVNFYFIYQDLTDLKENFAVSTKKVILVDEEEVLTGFLLNGEIDYLADEDIAAFSSYLDENNYEKILGDSYKLMIFNVDIISDLETNEIEIREDTITRNRAISILRSGEPFILLGDEELESDTQLKAEVFGTILAEHILSSENPLFFFSEFKKGNIVIYPQTSLFKTLKFIPLSLIKDASKKVLGKTKDKAKAFVEDKI